MAKSVKSAMSPAAIVFALVASALYLCPKLAAQSPECNSALATETEQRAQDSTIIFTGVEFRTENPLSADVRSDLVTEISSLKLSVRTDEPDSDWINGPLDRVRLALIQQGYFQNLVDGGLTLLRSTESERQYVLGINIKAGSQFRLGEIRVTDSLLFSEGELREQFAMRSADLFDGKKMQEGMEAIRRLYLDSGYIDFTAEPTLSLDDERNLVNVVMKITEGPQYRISKVRVLGLPPGMAARLRSLPEVGAPFNWSAVERFFAENRAFLPESASADKDVRLDRNSFGHSADVVLDFRQACPDASVPVQTTQLVNSSNFSRNPVQETILPACNQHVTNPARIDA